VLAERIARAARSLPAELADPGARRALERIVVRAPPVGHPFGFECRLAPGQGPVDLGIGVVREQAASLADWADPRGPAWAPLVTFLRRWRRDQLLASWIPFLFLEFDADAGGEAAPLPSLFLALDSSLSRPSTAETAPEVRAALHAFATLHGRADLGFEECLQRAYTALPDDARLLHVGALLGRGTEQPRISVSIAAPAAADYLLALGGREAARGLDEGLEPLRRRWSRVQLDFDAGPEPRPRCGVGLRPVQADGDWDALFADLEDAGWACPGKLAALRRWSGSEPRGGRSQRRLSHLKVVCAPGRRPESKAYLEVADTDRFTRAAQAGGGGGWLERADTPGRRRSTHSAAFR
jgi:hypothetical protein